jgi:hypothetical protein
MTGLGFFWLDATEVDGVEFAGAEFVVAEPWDTGLVELGFVALAEVWLACITLTLVGAVFNPDDGAEWGALALAGIAAAPLAAEAGADCAAA